MTVQHGPCPFAWSDRVDHHRFGFGIVNGEPTAVVGPSDTPHYKIVPKGWSVPVRWDDEARGETKVSSDHLRLVEQADARGAPYWRVRYDQIAERVRGERSKTDIAIHNGFRPKGASELAALRMHLEHEKAVLIELIGFLEEDDRGEHP